MESHGDNQGYGRLWSMLNQTYWVMIRTAERELRSSGLTMIQAATLYWVKTLEKPPTAAELSRLLFRRPHTVSDLLDRMEKQGLVRRQRDAKRKNVTRVILTRKGEDLYEAQRGLRAIARIMSDLSPRETESMMAMLEKLRNRAIEDLKSGAAAPYGHTLPS